jgi:pilus assembly protein Flp/PilA
MEQLMSRIIELSKSAALWLKAGSKRGASAVEYGLLAALIALVIIAAVTTVGTNLKGVFTSISTQVHS